MVPNRCNLLGLNLSPTPPGSVLGSTHAVRSKSWQASGTYPHSPPTSLSNLSLLADMGAVDSISKLAALLPLPAVVLWRVLTTTHAPYNKHRGMKRIMGDAALRYIIRTLSVAQLQAQFGSTLNVYTKWAKQVKMPVVVDELGDDARLLWLGPKRLDHVILFVHGGGFALPPPNSGLLFWQHVRLEMEKKGVEPGIVMLNYSLWPSATFPKPLSQLQRAVSFLLDAGVEPTHLQLAGDSAGGNLIVQLLSHALHPHPDVAPLTLSAPFRSINLLSPWVGLLGETPSYAENDGIDWMARSALVGLGRHIIDGFPESYRHTFAEPYKAPAAWFSGVEKLVSSVLITVGEAECMRDDILQFGALLEKNHPRVEVVVQPGGFHEDMFLDFDVGAKVGMLTPLIVDRLVA
ncbi:Alpha/Beta hydrolase protein [Roridomyces roridus]|uniref:Alpha/Beta hydrolase protein n=1 Tax=Roridomyces roridus TaxID=1738132 RepID=A0AAD7CL70_9AGAR|nr:Alpha/Beta hydrolase protein [Roridomyces roridus]